MSIPPQQLRLEVKTQTGLKWNSWAEGVGGGQVKLVRAVQTINALQGHSVAFCSLCRVCLSARTTLLLAVAPLHLLLHLYVRIFLVS